MREKSFARCCSEKWMYFEGWHTRFLLSLSQLLWFFNLTHRHTHTHTGSEAEPLPESWWFLRWEQISLSDRPHITSQARSLSHQHTFVASGSRPPAASSQPSLVSLPVLTPTPFFFLTPFTHTCFFSIFKSSSTHDSHCLLIIPLYFCKRFFALCNVWNIITL